MFSDEVHHFFDGALACNHISLDVIHSLILFAPGDPVIEQIVTEHCGPRALLDRSMAILDRTDEIIADKVEDSAVFAAIIEVALIHLSRQALDFADVIAHDLAGEAASRSGKPLKKRLRRSMADRYQWDKIKNHRGMRRLRYLYRRLIRMMLRNDVISEMIDLGDLNRRIEAYWERLDSRARGPRQPSREDRRSLRRQMKIATAILGEEVVDDFLRQRDVTVRGKSFSFKLKHGGIFKVGHGALDVMVCSSDGDELAEACFYFSDTPALDQLVAFHLYAKAGIEEEIIKTANLSHWRPEGKTHPLLTEMRKAVERERDAVVPSFDLENLMSPRQEWVHQHSVEITNTVTDKIFMVLVGNMPTLATRFRSISDKTQVAIN